MDAICYYYHENMCNILIWFVFAAHKIKSPVKKKLSEILRNEENFTWKKNISRNWAITNQPYIQTESIYITNILSASRGWHKWTFIDTETETESETEK